MAKNLVIVESPAKGKTIEKYLGSDYRVLASYGHVRDLPKSKLGVEVDKNFKPDYVIPSKAKKVISQLKEESAKAQTLYLATDYDREGEAIGWHLIHALGLKDNDTRIKRITFHEITKPAIQEAIKNPRKIDMNLVDAQQARRVLDRLVGYKLSPFLWKKVVRGLSAGRVQSVTLRLIVEREREIKSFNTEEYWSIEAILTPDKKSEFKAILVSKDGKKIDKMAIKNEKEAQEFLDGLNNAKYLIKEINVEEKKRFPNPPFTTSTLQQDAARRLGYSAKQTMTLAQKLYESGLITYMRTDSVQVSKIALEAAPEVITKEFGKDYALSLPRVYKTKSKGAQEAHEAIRPTDLALLPKNANLESGQARLYDLIWRRMIASQMSEAVIEETKLLIEAEEFGFSASGIKLKFDGFLKIYGDIEKENLLPSMVIGQELSLVKLDKNQHFTEPPARYSEGTLVKELEKRGIGRPSTYAPTISTIQDRGYVEKVEGRFQPKEIGIAVNDLLVEHFPKIVDYNFTAKMEEDLDEVAEGSLKWQPVIKNFYEPFIKELNEKMETVSKSDLSEETNEKCPECGKKLMIKIGRFGKFMACSGFPECKFTKPILDQQTTKNIEKIEKETGEKCPKCGKDLVIKEAKFGPFLACTGYPECKYTKTISTKAEASCPNCGGDLVKKGTRKGKMFWGCANYPKCKTAYWDEPTKEKCPVCDSLMLKTASGKLKCGTCK